MNEDGSNLQPDPTANGPGLSDGAREFEPDDPIFALAAEVYDRLRADVTPEEALERAIGSTREFLTNLGLADESQPGWGWVLEPVFDLPVGWSTPGADPEGAALARERFENNVAPAVISIPAAATVLAYPVIGHDPAGRTIAGAVIAIPLKGDVTPDDNAMVGVATGGGILGVQLENSMRARAARRSLQLAQAASRTQRSLVEPTDRGIALDIAMKNLAECEMLAWGVATEANAGESVETHTFGDRNSDYGAAFPTLTASEMEALERDSRAELPVRISGQTEATITIQSHHTLGVVERDTLDSIASAVAGTVERFRASETIETLRRSATRRLVEAQERERSMVAADIHDGVLQQLGATAIRLELAQSRVEQHDYQTASGIIADGAKEIRSCARELRALLMELRPQVLDDNGLNAALNELGRHVDGVNVTVESDVPDDLGNEFAITIFRIVQEALTNIEKHAQASSAAVKVALESGAIRIHVTDDGVGYEGAVTGPSAEGSHLGLLGMRERAQMFGGTFSISGASGGGTEIDALLPLGGGASTG